MVDTTDPNYLVITVDTSSATGGPSIVAGGDDSTSTTTDKGPSTTDTATDGDATISGTESTVTTAPSETEASPAISESASESVSSGQPNDDKLEPGAVAGVAIGCLAAGLIIGFILGWLLRQSRIPPKHRKRRRSSEERVGMLKQPKENGSMALEPLNKKIELEHVILQPPSDREITGDLERLELIMEQQVEAAFYNSGPVDVKAVTLTHTLTTLGINKTSSGFDAEAVAQWCLQPNSRRRALQHVISHVLFSSIDWNSRGPLKLLPKPAVGFLNSIRPVEEYRDNFDVMSFAWTRWRTLTALFLHPAPNDRTPLKFSEPDIQDQAEAVAAALNSFLHFFLAPDQESRRKQLDHLYVMVIEAAKLGYVLFSHPSDWRFIYKDQSGKGGAVVCVGLDKLSGPDGRRLASPERIAEPGLMS